MSKYRNFSKEETEELLSNYLIDSWSYSKVRSFSSNEKEFEMKYIYRCRTKSSANTIAGQAYHAAIGVFFNNLRDGVSTDIVDLEAVAFKFIDDIPAFVWKLQKTTPTIEECKIAATKSVSALLRNFMEENQIYLDELYEVLGVELNITAWLSVNGVDIPMPCNMAIDLLIRTTDGRVVVVDHKSKVAFTDEKEIRFSIGKQAITYVLGYEEKFNEKVDEVWFVENKQSKNKDKSPQLIKHIVKADPNTRRLYEALLYEPLKRMIEAVGNPDYVYVINDNDNLSDKADVYDFWAQTMIAEIDSFNIPEHKKPLLRERLRKIRDSSLATITPTVLKNFRKYAEQFIPYDLSDKDMTEAEKIEHVLRSFGIVSRVQHSFIGYSSASYLLEVNAGVQISSIQRYKLDIANALNVSNVRIQKDLFVYQNKSYLVVESGQKNTSTLAWDRSKLNGDNKLPLGVDNFQQTVVWDIDNHSTPHMLVCGATGSGKSVFLRSTIEYAIVAGVSDIVIFDPKYEFVSLSKPGIQVINDIESIEKKMKSLVEDMQKRVVAQVFKKTLVVFDEFADAVANSRKGRQLEIKELVQDGFYAPKKMKGPFGEFLAAPVPRMVTKVTGMENSLEENLRILLQKGRSVGFRIIAATQRASTKVITGDAKVNFPVQVCFRVPKDVDSIVVLDEPGAESLNGRGDGLIKSPEYLGVVRFQGFYKE